MNAKIKIENARIQRAMQAKSANPVAKANGKPKAVKPLVKSKSNPPAPVKPVENKRSAKTLDKPTTQHPDKPTIAMSADKQLANDPLVEANPPALVESSKPAQQIIVRAGTLKAALNAVERAVAKKSTLPILSTIHMETVGDGGIKLTATNLDLTLWNLADAKVLHAGAVCVPPLLSDLIAKVNDDALVTLTTNPKTYVVHVEAGRVSTNIKAYDSSEFPLTNIVNGGAVHIGMDVLPETIVEIAKRVTPFASTDDARPVLTGIGIFVTLPKFSGESATVTYASADGFRLAILKREATLHFDNPKMESLALIIPAKAFAEILKLTRDESHPIQFLFHLRFNKKHEYDGGMLEIQTSAAGMRVNLLEGNFPDYTKIDNEPSDAPIIPLLASETIPALERASLFAASSIARLTTQPQASSILLQASSAEEGDYSETLPATFDPARVTPDGYVIAFNAKFLIDALKAVTYQDGANPVGVRVVKPSDPAFFGAARYRLIVMPMHIGRDGNESKPAPKNNQPANGSTPEAITASDKASKEVIAKVEARANGKAEPTKKATAVGAKSKANPSKSKTVK